MKKSERLKSKLKMREVTQKQLGEIIAALREENDLAQEDLAYESGIDRSFMSRIERGKNTFSMLTFFRIANALGCKGSDILIRLEKKLEENKIQEK